ncbi:hypothetical protein ACVWZL_001559 [Bradyrhizobium sp. GM2.4]
MDGRRKCWFLAEGIATVKKPIRARMAKDRSASLDENGTRWSAVVDARAEVLRSAPPEQSQPPVPEMKVADAASNLGTGSAAPIVDLPNQITSEHSVPGQVDVGQLLADAPQDMPLGARTAEAHGEARSWTAWFFFFFFVRCTADDAWWPLALELEPHASACVEITLA